MIEMTSKQRDKFAQDWYNKWIKPELNRRFGDNGIPNDFQLQESLILLPIGETPIVQFNNEIGWLIENPKLEGGRTLNDLEIWEPIYLFDILAFDGVLPPMVNNKRVAFMFLYKDSSGHHIFSDLNPLKPDYNPNDVRFKFDGKVIAQYLQNQLIDRVAQWARVNQIKLREIGLWTTLTLMPYPLSKIVRYIDAGEPDKARQALVEYCDTDFISHLVDTWRPIKAFDNRLPLFYEAVFAHHNGKYYSTIYTLMPHIEGVIVDWLYEIMPVSDVEGKTKLRIEQFYSSIRAIPKLEYAFGQALESINEFLQEGNQTATPFQKSGNWLGKIDPNFAPRHALLHGKHVPEAITEENSIKLFLLLDTICKFMKFYEVRVLGRNLGQNNQAEMSNDI